MSYQAQIDFVRDLFNRMQVHSFVSNAEGFSQSPDSDSGLRALVFDIDNYTSISGIAIEQTRANTMYRYSDEYDCNYFFFRLPEENLYCSFGPYLLSEPDEDRIIRKLHALDIPEERTAIVLRFYRTLPVITDEEYLLTILAALADHIWGENQHQTEYIEYVIPDQREPFAYVKQKEYGREESARSLALLEQIYKEENLMMDAVREGQYHKFSGVTAFQIGNNIERRSQDSLRNRKNYLVILKTLLRKAAEYGNVHPYHIDREASLYARKIEECRTIRDCDRLQNVMIKDFCQLVKNYSLNHYSPLVGRAVTIIAFDLTADLRLKTLAEMLNVHPSYLSAQFHKECGCTLTEYVNKKRIELAVSQLESSDKQIQTIATLCGIPDTNYFIKLFKRHTGLTPSQYRSQL